MISRALMIAMLLVCSTMVGCGISDKVSDVEASPPGKTYFTAQAPGEALSKLSSLCLDGDKYGRVELLDLEARRLVITVRHPMTSELMSLLVVRAETADGGSTLRMWSRGWLDFFHGKTFFEDTVWNEYCNRIGTISHYELIPESTPAPAVSQNGT